MKLTIFILIVVCLHVSAAGYGQNGTVTISGKDLSLEKVFSVIKKQTDYVCFYGYEVLKDAKPVSLSFKNADVQEVLKAALWGQGLDFSITGKTITVVKKEEKNIVLSGGPGKTVKASGAVYNEAGQPLAGANVTIKATGKGTITNAKGEFTLPAVPESSPLIVSFIGYTPQTLKVSEGTSMQVYLSVAKNELDKVVVQAYGTTTQRLATGNIATVTAAEIERQPVMNALTALQGKVPGVVVQETSGYASAPFKVEIRGRSVINPDLPSEPLYIIDGVPLTVLELNGGNYESGSLGFTQNGLPGPASGQSPFFSLNPSDIESITVLKDADATAIYGSRGANGVIVITTKKGKAGKTKFEMNVYQGLSEVTRHYSMLNTQQYLGVRHEAFYNDSIAFGVVPDPGNAYDLLVWDTTRYTDWQKYLWGNMGKTTDAQFSLSGGDKQTTFRIGGAYRHQTDILTVSGADQRASVQFNLSHRSLNQRLSVSFTSTYSYVKSNLIGTASIVTLPPNAPAVFDGHGNLNWAGWDPVTSIFPFSGLQQPYTAKTGFLNSQLTLQYELLKGLVLSTKLGYSTTHNAQTFLQPITSQDPTTNPTGIADFGNNNGVNAIVEPQIEYKTAISKGQLDAMVGASGQSVTQDGNHIQGTGYLNDNLLHSIANAPVKYATDVSGQYKYAAVFGRINYNWDNKYIINISARRDGSSKFGSGRQFGNFGAIGAAWIFTEESWLKDHLKFLSFGKIRGSYGTTGSDQIPGYQYLTQWTGIGIPYQQGGISLVPTLHANPFLQWQVNKKLEGAIDLGFFQDRLSMEIAWYRNRCSNQLVPMTLPIITGFNKVTANLPATVENSGLEGTLTAKIIDKKDLGWNFNFNIGVNRNKLVAYPGLAQSPYATRFEIGKPLNIVKLLHYVKVDEQTGLYTFVDKIKDGQIDPYVSDTANDLYNKDMSIKFEGGFGTDVRYKGWELSLFFRFRKQEKESAIFNGYPGYPGNQSVQILNHWKAPGDRARFARYTTLGDDTDNNFFNYSDGVYSNGSYIRLQNVSLSYALPEDWTKKIGIQGCKIYVRGQNLFVITNYNGIDPDSPFLGAMPPSKVFTSGIQIAF